VEISIFRPEKAQRLAPAFFLIIPVTNLPYPIPFRALCGKVWETTTLSRQPGSTSGGRVAISDLALLKPLPAGVVALPLDGFPPVVIGALWRGRKTPLLETFLNEVKERARRLA